MNETNESQTRSLTPQMVNKRFGFPVNAEHIMLDVETTSLDPITGRVTSLAIVAFQLHGVATDRFSGVGSLYLHKRYEAFDGCGTIDNAETMEWRRKYGVDAEERSIVQGGSESDIVKDVYIYLQNINDDGFIPVLWAFHPEFDWTFMLAYNARRERPVRWNNVLHHRNIVDAPSFIMGCKCPRSKWPPAQFAAHSALWDCINQIHWVQHAAGWRVAPDNGGTKKEQATGEV